MSAIVFLEAGSMLGLDPNRWSLALDLNAKRYALLDHSTNRNRGSLESRVFGLFYLTLLGAWIGAVALPLDWQRDWQVHAYG